MRTAIDYAPRERTWTELREQWESQMRQKIREVRKRQALPPARSKHDRKPQPWDSVDLGERCDWTDLHKVTCGHCVTPDLYESNDFLSPEEAVA